MKLMTFKRWKVKQRDYNQRYKLRTIYSTSQRVKKWSGKYAFLLTKSTEYGIILRFSSEKECTAKGVVIIDDVFSYTISSKYILSLRRNREILQKSEVKICKRFKDTCWKLATEHPEKFKPSTTSINKNEKARKRKMLTCKICQKEFGQQNELEKHLKTHDQLNTSLTDEEISNDRTVFDESGHANKKVVTNDGKVFLRFKCYFCSKYFDSQQNMVGILKSQSITLKILISMNFIFRQCTLIKPTLMS
jgi:hypothetical protein